MNAPLQALSSAELRLELAEAEAERATTWKGGFAKRDRIAAITARLVKLGSF